MYFSFIFYQVIDEESISKLFEACQTGNYDKVDGYIEEIVRDGLPAAKILEQCFTFTLGSEVLTDAQKAKIFQKISVRKLVFLE